MDDIQNIRDLLVTALGQDLTLKGAPEKIAARYAAEGLSVDAAIVAWVLDSLTLRSLELLADLKRRDEPEPDPTADLGRRVAEQIIATSDLLPAGYGLACFLIALRPDCFQASLMATLDVEEFAPVLRGWLDRYDRGEAAPGIMQ